MKKILFVATVRSHIGQFHMPLIQELKNDGWVVDAAYKDNSADKQGLDMTIIDHVYEIPFQRQPLKKDNITAYRELKKVIECGQYDVIHCHTPMGAVITRLAARKARRRGSVVIYTAHGFHFFKGAALHNWLFYYPVEYILSWLTDGLILINNEDYTIATRKRFKAKHIYKTNGIGVDLTKFDIQLADHQWELREKYGYNKSDFILIYPADLSVRKNQTMLFQAIAYCKDEIPQIRLLLPGQPILLDEYKEHVKQLSIDENVDFLGYRRDIPELVAMADLAVSSSRQEGLPINIVEAMALGKPIVATDVRGNNDLVVEGEGGFLIPLGDSRYMANKIIHLYKDSTLVRKMGLFNCQRARLYSDDIIKKETKEIYAKVIEG